LPFSNVEVMNTGGITAPVFSEKPQLWWTARVVNPVLGSALMNDVSASVNVAG
jgi:hypothetical protein